MNPPIPVVKPIRISLILPVYNFVDHLHECLRNIIDQSSERTIEALPAEDCSTDQSLQICEEYAERDSDLLKLINHPENQCDSVSLNTDLENARGNYFMFGDPYDALARLKAELATKEKGMHFGLWRFTHHSNHQGNASVWWGFPRWWGFDLMAPGSGAH